MIGASADWPATRTRIIGQIRVLSWSLLGIILALAIFWRSDLLHPTPSRLLMIGIFVLALVVSRVPWPIANASYRQTVEFCVFLAAYTSVLWTIAPTANAIGSTYALLVVAARLVLPRSSAVWVLVLACLFCCALNMAYVLDRASVAMSLANCFVFVGIYYVADILRTGALAVDQRMRSASGRDALTTLPHRLAFIALAEKLQALAVEQREPHALLIIDINNLRAINERYGYSAGDRAITLVARALERLCENAGRLGRYDGDKFVLFLMSAQHQRAEELAKRIRSAIYSTTVDVDLEVVRIKANVGIARFPIDGISLTELMAAAETDAARDAQGREPPKKKPVFRRRSGKMSA